MAPDSDKIKRNDRPVTQINRCSITAPQKMLVTRADDSRAKKAKKCDGDFSNIVVASSVRTVLRKHFHKTRIVVPSMAMQVRVPVRHAPVSMLIRLCLISGCGTDVWP